MNIDIILNRRGNFRGALVIRLKRKIKSIKKLNTLFIFMSMQQKKISEDELDAVYKYLSIAYDEMTEEEQKMWVLLLSLNDPEFDDLGENDNL